jgi:hypothetical protein
VIGALPTTLNSVDILLMDTGTVEVKFDGDFFSKVWCSNCSKPPIYSGPII